MHSRYALYAFKRSENGKCDRLESCHTTLPGKSWFLLSDPMLLSNISFINIIRYNNIIPLVLKRFQENCAKNTARLFIEIGG